jgi:hypothetical protein
MQEIMTRSETASSMEARKGLLFAVQQVRIIERREDFSSRMFFFLSPRRRSGERIEERGHPSFKPQTRRLSLHPSQYCYGGQAALSSMAWRRGSVWLRLRRPVFFCGK